MEALTDQKLIDYRTYDAKAIREDFSVEDLQTLLDLASEHKRLRAFRAEAYAALAAGDEVGDVELLARVRKEFRQKNEALTAAYQEIWALKAELDRAKGQ